MTTVLWDYYQGRLLVDLKGRMEENLFAIDLLKTAATFGELFEADLPSWAESIVTTNAQNREFDHEEVSADTAWEYDEVSFHAISHRQIYESVPMPHAAGSVLQWLDGDFLREHADVGGGSPGGHIVVYDVKDEERFLDGLRSRGYDVERHEGLMDEYHDVL